MKKIMKMFSAVLIVCMVLSNIVHGEGSDTTAPELLAISIKTTGVVYKPGDTVEVEVKAKDDISGLASVGLHFGLEGTDGTGKNGYNVDMKAEGNECTLNFEVGKNMLSGIWVLQHVSLRDNAGNLNEYFSGDLLLDGVLFEVDNKQGDFEAPILNAISVTPNVGNSKSTVFQFQASVTDAQSEIDTVELTYFNGALDGAARGISLQLNSTTGYYEGIFDMSWNTNWARNLLLGYIRVSDKAGNAAYYSYREEKMKEMYSMECLHLDTNLDLILEDVIEDTDLPNLIDFEWKASQVHTPGKIQLVVKAEDATSGIASIDVMLADSQGNPVRGMVYYEELITNARREFVVELPVSKYTPSVSYSVYSIELIDAQGNAKKYSVNDENPIPAKKVNIVNDNQIDLLTSTADSDYINKIAVLPEGSIAVVDISVNSIIKKDLFDAVKGKNITVVFERTFGNEWDMQGIQWIINGNDIINETKDIDTNVYVEKASNTSWKDYFEKKHGEEMPTLEMGGITDEEVDELTKKLLVERGWSDVVEAVESARKDGESFSNAFVELYLGKSYLRIVFPENGLLPCKATIRMNVSYAVRNIIGVDDLDLYYYNENLDKYELVQKDVEFGADEYYEFSILHNSTYALSASGFDVYEESSGNSHGNSDNVNKTEQSSGGSAGSVKTGDNSPVVLFWGLIAISIVVIVCVKKRGLVK